MPENYLAMGLVAGIFAAGFLAGYGARSVKSMLRRRSVLERVRVYHQAASGTMPPAGDKPTVTAAMPPDAEPGTGAVASISRFRRKAS